LHEGEEPTEVKTYKSGDYFGELALLKNAKRAASVVAKTQLKLASIDRDSFKRLLGPLDQILMRNMADYQYYSEN
jgi:cAMP-dependent protein kinase regulator